MPMLSAQKRCCFVTEKRREFPRSVRVACIQRATRDGVIYCEQCKAMAKRFQIDHIVADAIGGEPVLENAMLLCEPCHAAKTPGDTTKAAKTKRQEAKHIGATRPKGAIRSPGFAKVEKTPRIEKQRLAPREIYEDVG